MSSINQKEYLKRYLAGADDTKKKKKKKKKDKLTNQATKGFVIVDADLGSLSSIPFGMDDHDDAPTIAEITYDSVKTKLRDEYQTSVSKWKKTTGTVEEGKKNVCHDGELQKAPVEETLEQSHVPGRGSKSVVQRKQRYDSDSDDESLPKKTQGDGVKTLQKKQRHDTDSDESSPKTQKVNQLSESPVIKKVRHDSDSDESPPRHITQTNNPGNIHADKKRHDSNSDAPAPRLQSKISNLRRSRGSRWDFDEGEGNSRSHTVGKQSRHDSDESPPRKSRSSGNDPSKPPDSDESPPRKKYDSDESPPRKAKKVDSDESPPRISSIASDKTSESRPEKHMTTSEYLLARKRGKLKKDSPEELARKERESELQREAELKHKQWNRGVAQLVQQQQRVDDIAHEMTKSFARSADDVDMNEHCKSKLLADDPMLEYLSNKKGKKEGHGPRKPLYEGPFPPNRFNIRPGYRWDGVDRSNGFEQDYFAKQSSKIAIEEDAYKYCAEDM